MSSLETGVKSDLDSSSDLSSDSVVSSDSGSISVSSSFSYSMSSSTSHSRTPDSDSTFLHADSGSQTSDSDSVSCSVLGSVSSPAFPSVWRGETGDERLHQGRAFSRAFFLWPPQDPVLVSPPVRVREGKVGGRSGGGGGGGRGGVPSLCMAVFE